MNRTFAYYSETQRKSETKESPEEKKQGSDVRLLRKNYMKIKGPFNTKSPDKNLTMRFPSEEYPVVAEWNPTLSATEPTPVHDDQMKSATDTSSLRSQADILSVTIKHMKKEMNVLLDGCNDV